ncbi:hypothetical protein [Paraburkholderia sediminicola]|uniref:hypothetical protein n=1 Tax=Paraburkholderia sediminicola TaxID=458836 RepID=UPI0038BCFA81
MDTINLLDLSYDHLFESRKTLPWWPWVGSQFGVSPVKTMVLGESVYEWDSLRGAAASRYAQTTGLRITHNNHALSFGRDTPYVRNIERAIFSALTPADDQKLSLWTSVAYHNLVLELLPSNGHRPSDSQFRAGWHETLDLCEQLQIEQCLVYGVESADALRAVAAERNLACSVRRIGAKVGGCYPRHGVLESGDRQLKLLFVRHPSKFFSWRRWSPVIRSNLTFEFVVQAAEAPS